MAKRYDVKAIWWVCNVVMEDNIFDKYSVEYDDWFEENQVKYLSELNLITSLIPLRANGIEIGVCTGFIVLMRF